MSNDDLGFLDDIVLDVNKPSGESIKLPTLYTKSSGGALQEWTIEVCGDRFRTIAGQQGGTLTTSKWTVCLPKNEGRANETSAEAQAMAEARAKWKKKVKAGGSETPTKAGDKDWIHPMLAQTWQKLKKIPDYPLGVQYKFNGMRCIISKKGMFTRKGEPIISAPHVWYALEELFTLQPNLVLDGELYNHELGERLNQIIKLVRKTKHVDQATLAESARLIKFYCYNGYNVNGYGADAPYEKRKTALESLLKDYPVVVNVKTTIVNNQKEQDKHFDECKVLKYEGQMIYVLSAGYENKRSKYLIKRKDFMDDEFEIVGVNEGTGNASGMAATFTCKLESGETFETNLKGPDDLMIQVWNNKDEYIGQKITVVFQQLSEYGVPQFPYADPSILRNYE